VSRARKASLMVGYIYYVFAGLALFNIFFYTAAYNHLIFFYDLSLDSSIDFLMLVFNSESLRFSSSSFSAVSSINVNALA